MCVAAGLSSSQSLTRTLASSTSASSRSGLERGTFASYGCTKARGPRSLSRSQRSHPMEAALAFACRRMQHSRPYFRQRKTALAVSRLVVDHSQL
jgi:hypothetical protein